MVIDDLLRIEGAAESGEVHHPPCGRLAERADQRGRVDGPSHGVGVQPNAVSRASRGRVPRAVQVFPAPHFLVQGYLDGLTERLR